MLRNKCEGKISVTVGIHERRVSYGCLSWVIWRNIPLCIYIYNCITVQSWCVRGYILQFYIFYIPCLCLSFRSCVAVLVWIEQGRAGQTCVSRLRQNQSFSQFRPKMACWKSSWGSVKGSGQCIWTCKVNNVHDYMIILKNISLLLL